MDDLALLGRLCCVSSRSSPDAATRCILDFDPRRDGYFYHSGDGNESRDGLWRSIQSCYRRHFWGGCIRYRNLPAAWLQFSTGVYHFCYYGRTGQYPHRFASFAGPFALSRTGDARPGLALDLLFVNWDSVTGGDNGLLDIPFASLGPFEFDNFINYINLVYLVFVVMLLMLGIAAIFVFSRFGRNLRAVRDDPIAARACGINVGLYRLASFALSGIFAGVAGSLYTVWIGTVGPSAFDLNQSIFVLAQVLIGGLGTLSGPVIGAVGLVWLDQYLLAYGDWHNIIYGSLITIIVLLARGGIVGGIKALWNRLQPRSRMSEQKPVSETALVVSAISNDMTTAEKASNQ